MDDDDFMDDEPFELEPATVWDLSVDVDAGGPVKHVVSAYYVPVKASDAEVKEAILYWLPTEYCQHEHDCCGQWYAREGDLISRTYGTDTQDIIFVLRTHTMNV